MSVFHQNLTLLRKSKRLSQTEAGEIFGVSQDTWSRWERDREPDYEKLIQIADFFNIRTDLLITLDLTEEKVELYPVFSELPAGRRPLLQEPEVGTETNEDSPPVNVDDWAALAARLLYLEGEVAKLRQRVKELEGKM